MLGQLVFAELPFACIGSPPYIERGWINDCTNKNEWDKQPIATSQWQVAAKRAGDWGKRPAATSQWQVIDRAVGGWDKQPANDLNTIGCGDFKPSNLGGNK